MHQDAPEEGIEHVDQDYEELPAEVISPAEEDIE